MPEPVQNNARPPADEVVESLRTTAAKIRARALAGYKRAEIRNLLGIRYQHVRRVLLAAGIHGGLQSEIAFERAPVALEATAKRKPTSAESLLRGGFTLLGEWKATPLGGIGLTAKAPAKPGVYVFAVDGWVRYVGLTQKRPESSYGPLQARSRPAADKRADKKPDRHDTRRG